MENSIVPALHYFYKHWKCSYPPTGKKWAVQQHI